MGHDSFDTALDFPSHRIYPREDGQNMLGALEMPSACLALGVPLLLRVPRAVPSSPEPGSQRPTRMRADPGLRPSQDDSPPASFSPALQQTRLAEGLVPCVERKDRQTEGQA